MELVFICKIAILCVCKRVDARVCDLNVHEWIMIVFLVSLCVASVAFVRLLFSVSRCQSQ